MELYPKSVLEVSSIAAEAAKELATDALQWLGDKASQLDEWLCDYGD